MINRPKPGSLHSGDFGCIAVGASGIYRDTPYPTAVCSALCFDGLSCPDWMANTPTPDQLASRTLRDSILAHNLHGFLPCWVPDLPFHQEPPFYEKSGDVFQMYRFGALWSEQHAPRVDDVVEGWRYKALSPYFEPLEALAKTRTPVHHFAGVYGCVHMIYVAKTEYTHYVTIGSGDVRVRARIGGCGEWKDLNHDTNAPADIMGERLGIPGPERYAGKVGHVYDVLGPKSRGQTGPLVMCVGKTHEPLSLILETDGHYNHNPKDDATSIRIDIGPPDKPCHLKDQDLRHLRR